MRDLSERDNLCFEVFKMHGALSVNSPNSFCYKLYLEIRFLMLIHCLFSIYCLATSIFLSLLYVMLRCATFHCISIYCLSGIS